MAVWAHFVYEIDEKRPRISNADDAWLIWCQQFAACMAFTGLIFETALAVAIEALGMRSVCFSNPTFSNRLRLNRKMLYLFTMLTTVYQCMAFDVQYVHKGWIANYHGGHQVIYSIRYIEWTVCAPMVFSVVGYLEPGPDGKPRNGLHTSGILTGIYCIISWQGLVVTDFWGAWALITWAFISFFVASYEQLVFAWHIRKSGRAGPIRSAMVFYLVFMITLYGIIYLLPIPGWITATMEQKFYCFADASFKVGCSATLLATRYCEDMASNAELQVTTKTQAEDLGRLVETAAVPIFGVDKERNIVQWNNKMADLTGLSRSEAVGLPLLDMMPGSCFENANAMLDEAMAGKKPNSREITVEPSMPELEDGQVGSPRQFTACTLVISATAARDKSGTVVGATCMGYDLTEIAAIREAEVRKQRFLAVVSHELRSPLHGIIGLSDSLASQQKDQNHVKKLKMVKNCAMRLLDLVVNIMEMASMVSKDPSGKKSAPKKLNRDEVDLPKLLEELMTLINNACDKSGRPLLKDEIKLINNMLPSMPIIEADIHKCTQVFENLLTNACKFTKKGAITVSSAIVPGGEFVEVSISDTGKGISEEARSRIFEPFEQEEATEMRQYEGIGLGLPIASEVVKRHGGRIILESRLNVGSTFTVRLPVVMQEVFIEAAKKPASPFSSEDKRRAGGPPKAAKDPPPPAEQEEEEPDVVRREARRMTPETGQAQLQHKPTILLVTDGSKGGPLLEASDEFVLHSASDAKEVRKYLCSKSQLPDLLLMDSAAGRDVCDAVHDRLRSSSTMLPLIMLAPAGSAGGGQNGKAAQQRKSVDPQELKDRIMSVLRLKRATEPQQMSLVDEPETAERRRRRSRTHPPGSLMPLMPNKTPERSTTPEVGAEGSERRIQASVLRCDIVGWADIMQSLPATKAMKLIDELFEGFDELASKYDAQRLESASGTYMCSVGSEEAEDHAKRIAMLGLEILAATTKAKSMASWPASVAQNLQLRVGAHTGPAFLGPTTTRAQKQVLFGDAVSVASSLQENCSPGCMHMSSWTYQELSASDRLGLADAGARVLDAGPLELPGRGKAKTHMVAPRGATARPPCGDNGAEAIAACKELKEELKREQELREELEARAEAARRAAEIRGTELAELQQKMAEAEVREELAAKTSTHESQRELERGRQALESKLTGVKFDDSNLEARIPTSMPAITEVEEEDGSRRPSIKEEPSSTPRKPARMPIVLSVDDDIVNQAVIESALSDQYEIHVAMDGTEALEYFQSHSRLPDVMLLDVMMPGMSGFEVCKAVRDQLRLPATQLPVVMLSARSPVEKSVIEGLENGCNDYISKPFEKEVLKARVHTALQIKRLHDSELRQSRYEELLHSIMPPHVIERLQAGETTFAESHNLVTILFSDIVGWTNIAEMLTTSQVVVLLNELFSAFDDLTEKYEVFKVETIGDAYMCAAGHDGSKDHAQKIARFGLAMIEATSKVKPPAPGLRLQIRVGAHTGPAYTGVVGRKVPRYCFFGDTVNVSSRMESHGSPGCLHVSNSMYKELMTDDSFQDSIKARIVQRGTVEIKGKGSMLTHLIVPEGTVVPPTVGRKDRRISSAPPAALLPEQDPSGTNGGDCSPCTDDSPSPQRGSNQTEERLKLEQREQQLCKDLKAAEAAAVAKDEARSRAESEAKAETQACAEARRKLEAHVVARSEAEQEAKAEAQACSAARREREAQASACSEARREAEAESQACSEVRRELGAQAAACSDARKELEGQAGRLAAMEGELAAGRRLALELEEQLRAAEQRSREQAESGRRPPEELSASDEEGANALRQRTAVLEREKTELQEKLRAVEAERSVAQIARAELQERLRELEEARAQARPSTTLPAISDLAQQPRKPSWALEIKPRNNAGLCLAKSPRAEAGHLPTLEKQVKHLALEVKLKERKLQTCRDELIAKTDECEALRQQLDAKRHDAETVEDELQHALLDLGALTARRSLG